MAHRTLPYLAALLPKNYEVKIVDDRFGEVCFESNVHLVMISALLLHMPRVLEIAKKFNQNGVPVIIGGPGVDAYVQECGQIEHATVVIGEIELLVDSIITDFENDRLKKVYKADHFPELSGLPLPRFDLINNRYFPVIAGFPYRNRARMPVQL